MVFGLASAEVKFQYESTKRVQGAAGAGYCYWKERPAAILWLGMSILARVVYSQNWLSNVCK